MMQKIGIFGGTFDPIHLGHLNFAQEILEMSNLDQIWFIPANISPFKTDKKVTEPHHRLKMVELAISGVPQFKVLDLEISREGTSFTIDTVKELVNEHPSTDFHLIISDETHKDFLSWKAPDQISRLAPLIIGSRNGTGEEVIPVRKMDISATEVRKRLQSGLYCGHLLPQKVLDYIYKNRLYCKH